MFTFPKCDFIGDSSFVVLVVIIPNKKVLQSYELYHRIYSSSKGFYYWLTQFLLPPFRDDSLAYAIYRHMR